MVTEMMDSTEFLERVRPALEARDPDRLAEIVNKHWTCTQLCWLLSHGDADTRKVVCLTLGLVGEMHCVPCLTSSLRDEDPQVSRLGEHALWSIWFRSGSETSRMTFHRGLEALEKNDLETALKHFHQTTVADPDFAEAFNQCAIVHYLLEQWEQSIEDCRETVKRVPTHFGAWAGMGHGHAQLGDLEKAAECYRKALSINPRMEAIAGTLARIEERLNAA